jgi:hypothetical protein
MSGPENGRSPVRLPAIGPRAGADAAECDPEAMAAWTSRDAEAVAAENRVKAFGRERLRADVRSLATQAVATLRELITGSDVPPSVRLRASLAILQAADAMAIEGIGPTSAEGVQAKRSHDAFIESLGG